MKLSSPPPCVPPLFLAWNWRRLLTILIPGLLLLLAAAGFIEFYLHRPMGSGPAGPEVDKAAFEAEWSNREVLLAAYGDSIAAGFGASPEKSLFQRLSRNPTDEFPEMQGITLSHVFPHLTSLNAAVSGSNSIEHLALLDAKIPQQNENVFGVVVLTTGGNDLIHPYGRTPPRDGAMYGATLDEAQPWIANFEKRLGELLDRITAKFPGGCEIFVANIYDPTDGEGDPEHAGLPPWPEGLAVHAAYNEVIEKVAKSKANAHLVNIQKLFLGHGIHCRKFWRRYYVASDPYYWYYENLEDPNDRGYDALRRAFLVEMAKVLPERLKPKEAGQEGEKKK